MRKIIILISIFICVGMTFTQFNFLDNYVYTRTYLGYHRNNQTTKTTEMVLYFDDPEMPKQIVNIKALPLGQDTVTLVTYDTFRGQILNYLSFPQAGILNEVFITGPLSNKVDITYCFEKISPEYTSDDSSLNTTLEKINRVNKSVKFEYNVNTTEDNLIEFNQLI